MIHVRSLAAHLRLTRSNIEVPRRSGRSGHDDTDWDTVLTLADRTSPYALAGSIFTTERTAISQALSVLRDTAGTTYVNDEPTGALMGWQYFGGGRASGTNDKTGSPLALRRRVSGRYIKENMNPDLDWTYPFMGTEGN
ncbi:1-pyrroline-5-carboxylate dehydrogenase [Streptomyces hygroscopicus]|nr:1-pyrroline-5-carboxylate dehydrogenase [Streptomyces hygroscopicus]